MGTHIMGLTEFTENTVKKLEPVFKKVNGGYFGITGAIASAIFIGIAAILFFTIEPFTIYSHWISNLGGAVTNAGAPSPGANIVFSVGLIVTAVLVTFFVIDLTNKLFAGDQKAKFLVVIFIAAGILSLVGILGVAFFDMKSSSFIHIISATAFFFGGLGLMLFFGLACFFNSGFSRLQGVFSLAMAGIGSIFLLQFVPLLLAGENLFVFIVSASSTYDNLRFWEWIWLFSFLAWILETGIYSVKKLTSG